MRAEKDAMVSGACLQWGKRMAGHACVERGATGNRRAAAGQVERTLMSPSASTALVSLPRPRTYRLAR